jgi:hypothetical protein
MITEERQRKPEKIPSALPQIAWSYQGFKPDLFSEKPASNRMLCHDHGLTSFLYCGISGKNDQVLLEQITVILDTVEEDDRGVTTCIH